MMEEALAKEIGELLRERSKTLAVAESCTGGLLGHLITTVPGSSDYFLGGFITYTNAAKTQFLDVPSQTIEQHGAVSEETARAMAAGARQRFGSDFALSITGIAGPGGGSAEKPVGLTWIGFSSGSATRATRYVFQGDRTANQRAAASQALSILLNVLKGFYEQRH